MTTALAEQRQVMAEELAKRNQQARDNAEQLRTTLDDTYKQLLAPALGFGEDIQANNRALIPTTGARLNAAIEQAGYGPADQTWQEGVVRRISEGLDTVAASAERAFGTLRSAGGEALTALVAAAEGGGQALAGFGQAADATAEDLSHLEPALAATAQGVQQVEQAGAAAGQSLAKLGERGVASSSLGDLDRAGSGLNATLEDLASETGRVEVSMAKMGAAGAAAGAGLRGGVDWLKGLGPAGLATAAALGVLTAALYESYDAALKAEKEHADLERALRASGASATVSVKELQDHAATLTATTMASRDEVLAAGTALARYHAVVGDAFGRTLTLAQDMAAALGGDVRANAEKLGQALDDPARALDLLTSAGGKFSEQERDLIQDLTDGGRAFEAQQAILAAVARDLGGSGVSERAGLIGQTKALTEAWAELVRTITGSDTAIGQAAAGIVGGVTRILGDINAALDASTNARIAKLEQERDVLAMQLSSNDFGVNSVFSLGYWNNNTDAARARQRLETINAELAGLQAKQRQDEFAADLDAEEWRNAAVAAERGVLNDRLAALHAEHEQRLRDLTTDRIEKITQAEEQQITHLEGMRAELLERGGDTAAIDTEIELVRRIALAERAQAEARGGGTDAVEDETDANQRLIETLQFELEVLHLSERDRQVEHALRKLSADASEDQRQKVRDLAAALYDEKQALEASNRATEVMTRLRRELAEINLSDGDRAAARAADQLGEHASAAAKAEGEASYALG
ncbi:hypothetical protein WCLP8_300002 [uncultured Gammaproteobacteria bacterium]